MKLLTFSHERGCWMAKGVGACTHWLECSAGAARHLFDAGYVVIDAI